MPTITNINKLDLKGSYTYADYLTWNFKERLELFRGKIFKMSPAPNRNHQTISGRMYLIFAKALQKNTCNVYYAPFDVRLVKKITTDEKVLTVVQPDLCIICDENKLDDKGCIGAPDLVVEILSPGNTKKEMGIKFDLYEENEVKEYWLVDPTEKTVLVYTLQNKKFIGLKPFIVEDVLKSPLFPSLKFKVRDIFFKK
jgi:Uma2 family endonuclease